MRHTSKKIVKIIASATIYSVIFGAVIFGFNDSLYGVILGDINTSIIKSAPIYEYQDNNKENIKEDKESLELQLGVQYGMIECDRIKLKTPIYFGDYDKIFEVGAGTSLRHEIPGRKGTSLIGAHDSTFFAPLKDIKSGDIIEIDTIYGHYSYEVTDIKIQKVTDYKPDNQKDLSKIILYTCYPFGEVNGSREERYYVYATKR